MTSLEAANFARQRFEDFVQTPFDLAVDYDNAPTFTPPDDAVWCRVTFLDGEANQITLGRQKRFHNFAMMTVQVFGPRGKGDARIREIVDKLVSGYEDDNADPKVSLFRAVKINGLTWRTPSVTNAGNSGAYFQFNVNCPLYYEDFALTD
jgi:hypothetical protein